MNRPVPNPGILDIAPYTPGKTPVPEPGTLAMLLAIVGAASLWDLLGGVSSWR